MTERNKPTTDSPDELLDLEDMRREDIDFYAWPKGAKEDEAIDEAKLLDPDAIRAEAQDRRMPERLIENPESFIEPLEDL